MPRILSPFLSLLIFLVFAAGQASAQDNAPDAATGAETEGEAEAAPVVVPPPVYEGQLLRLSEILGSLSFLRDLCDDGDGQSWRDDMTALLAAEHPNGERRSRLVGRFNHGFETFNAVYRSCTPSAELAISRYLTEGQTLAADVRSRYSQ